MRTESAISPFDEPPHPGVFRAPDEYVDVPNEYRLIPELRARAKYRDPEVVLAHASSEFFKTLRPGTRQAWRAAIDLGNALADLAVTGRETYGLFRNLNLLAVEGHARQRLAGASPGDEEVLKAMNLALDRAYAVAWALRGPASERSALRAPLGWIAVSAEDDTPHRPVNMPAPPYEQFEVRVRTPLGTREIALWTRYLVAAFEPVATVAEPASRRRTVPNDPVPNIPADHEIILFLHGHSSGAEEALDIIPHLLDQGRRHGKKYAVISFDLPNNGYSETFDHKVIAPDDATSFPFVLGESKPIATPILDFIEDFVVAFVDAVEEVAVVNGTPPIKERIAAVIGGSLGGNLGLRLGRRHAMPGWLDRAIVAWSPASVWKAMVGIHAEREGSRLAFDEFQKVEADSSRQLYFFRVYDEVHKAGAITIANAQPTYWYREGFVNGAFNIQLSRVARREIYNAHYRQWHWRVACEQLIYSHLENEVYDDASTPVRCTLNTVRTLLAAGDADNHTYVGIYDGTRQVAQSMNRAPGRLLLVRDSGHSIHLEHPQYLATEIVKFIGGKSMEIRCVTRRAGRIERVGGFDHTRQEAFDLSQQECIAGIAAGDGYFVRDAAGQVADVVIGQRRVEPGPFGEVRTFIRTGPDETERNNLAALPSC
jgi:pimeloyl-ACP methyl ester carboxylesterase